MDIQISTTAGVSSPPFGATPTPEAGTPDNFTLHLGAIVESIRPSHEKGGPDGEAGPEMTDQTTVSPDEVQVPCGFDPIGFFALLNPRVRLIPGSQGISDNAGGGPLPVGGKELPLAAVEPRLAGITSKFLNQNGIGRASSGIADVEGIILPGAGPAKPTLNLASDASLDRASMMSMGLPSAGLASKGGALGLDPLSKTPLVAPVISALNEALPAEEQVIHIAAVLPPGAKGNNPGGAGGTLPFSTEFALNAATTIGQPQAAAVSMEKSSEPQTAPSLETAQSGVALATSGAGSKTTDREATLAEEIALPIDKLANSRPTQEGTQPGPRSNGLVAGSNTVASEIAGPARDSGERQNGRERNSAELATSPLREQIAAGAASTDTMGKGQTDRGAATFSDAVMRGPQGEGAIQASFRASTQQSGGSDLARQIAEVTRELMQPLEKSSSQTGEIKFNHELFGAVALRLSRDDRMGLDVRVQGSPELHAALSSAQRDDRGDARQPNSQSASSHTHAQMASSGSGESTYPSGKENEPRFQLDERRNEAGQRSPRDESGGREGRPAPRQKGVFA